MSDQTTDQTTDQATAEAAAQAEAEGTTKLREEIREEIRAVEGTLTDLGKEIDDMSETTEDVMQSKIDAAKAALAERKTKAKESKERVKKYLEDQVSEAKADIKGWKKNREINKLQRRAIRKENHAADAIEVAMSSVTEAHYAALEAIQARLELQSALTAPTES